MHDPLTRMKMFYEELRRRRVFRVVIIYCGASFVILQAADILVQALRLPDWSLTLTVFILALGFPIALVLAWAFDVTHDGLMRTPPAAVESSPGQEVEIGKPTAPRVAVIAAALVTVVLIVAVIMWFARETRGPQAEQPASSIAVLPFVDLSPEKGEEYFSDGLAEDLLNHLARIPGLRVVARTSAFQFKGKYEDLREIGRILNVTTILDGSVRRIGNRIRITAQLNNTSDGFTLWSESYDREMNDIFAIQEEIARSVAVSLKVTLVGAPPSQTKNVEAYAAYLQGRYLVGRRRKDDVEKAIGYYEQAIKLDPKYAPAWVSLAQVRCYQGNFGYAPVEESFREARKALKYALELNPDLARAHTALGWIRMSYDWDWEGANESFQRALALEPGDAITIGNAAMLCATQGRLQDAIVLDRRALELDPLSGWNYHIFGLHAFMAGMFDEAVAALEKALELTPDQPGTHLVLGRVYLAQMRLKEALAEMDREKNPSFHLFGLALVYHTLGMSKESDIALAELIAEFQTDMAYQIAEVYAYRGEMDQAFDWLERAFIQKDGGLAELMGSPTMKNLERDPRYTAFLKKMHLPV